MTSDTGKIKLPIVDLAKAKTDRMELATTVVDALENIGFLYIDNVAGIDIGKLLEACRWFFGQPWEVRNGLMRNFWNKENKNLYRGYFPVNEGKPSRKEGFEFGRDIDPNDPSVKPGNWFYEPSVWPAEDGSFLFKKTLTNAYNVLHDTGIEILRLTSLGLGIEENSFDRLFQEKPCSTFRLMHYPSWNGNPPENARIEDGKVVTTPDHTDSCFLTLLATFDYKGLEVLSADGEWCGVVPRPNSFVMNIGDLFSRMTCGRLKATRHRVLDIGVDRFSVPFFLEPAYDGDIGVNFMSKATGDRPEHVVEKYGPWVLQQMKYIKKFYEFKELPDI